MVLNLSNNRGLNAQVKQSEKAMGKWISADESLPLCVLYIEDSEDDQLILKRSLKKQLPMEVLLFTASSGEEGLKRIEDLTFDLIFLDYKLPGMSGLELMGELNNKNVNIPVIFVTSQGSEKIAVDAMKLGAMDYIVKEDIETSRIAEAVKDIVTSSILPSGIDVGIAKEILESFKESPRIRASFQKSLVIDPGLRSSDDKVISILDGLVSVGVVERTPLSSTFSCPICGALTPNLIIQCPDCADALLKKGDAIEHLPCGHVDFLTSYTNNQGNLSCPKCSKALKGIGVDYQKIGPWYKCSKGHVFNFPQLKYQCPDCEELMALDDMDIKNLYEYRITEQGQRMLRLGILSSGYRYDTSS